MLVPSDANLKLKRNIKVLYKTYAYNVILVI